MSISLSAPEQHPSVAGEDLYNFFMLSLNLFCIAGRDGYFKKVNPAFVRLLGYSEEELLSRPFVHFIHPDDVAETRRRMDLQESGAPVECFQNRYRTRQGTYIWLCWTTTETTQKGLIYAVAKDITKEKKQEELIRRQEGRFKKANQMAKLGSWEFDWATQKPLWASDELYAIYGLSREDYPELTVEVFMQFIHPEDKERPLHYLQDLERRTNYVFEHRFLRPDGRTAFLQHYIEVARHNGDVERLHGIVQDVTERKEAEQKLLLSEQRFRSLVHHSYEMIAILDLEGKYQYVSDSLCRILGYNQEDLMGKSALHLVHPDDVAYMTATLSRLFTVDVVDDVKPYRLKNKQGQWRWLESVGQNMTGDPAVRGVVVNTRDITDKKKLQDKLARELEQRKARINKAAIDAQEREREQLSRELHDNVNQVLTTIKLYTELAMDQRMDSKTLMQRSADYLTECINEIRSISKRLSTPTLGKISFEESIIELAQSLNLTGKLKIDLQLAKLPRRKLRQDIHLGLYRIVQEHLTNVLKHAAAQTVQLLIEEKGGTLHITIRDDGSGFDVKAKRKGIGISNMYGRIESLNGRLELVSAPGKGCTLQLSVPAW